MLEITGTLDNGDSTKCRISYDGIVAVRNLGNKKNPISANLTTNRRIKKFAQEDALSLATLYYNYGRYPLICSTRPENLPPNLQGL